MGDVQQSNGRVCVLIAPGVLGVSAQLNFHDKCFFTVAIGGQIYSNNDRILGAPPNYKLLSDGVTTKVKDTVRTIWPNKNGVDIIQDVYPIAYERSGQIILRWSIRNNQNFPAPAACQWLNDVQITDPKDHSHRNQSNSNDGPKILHRYGYNLRWERLPDTIATSPAVPWFYMAFLWQLPDLNPGLTGQAYLDYPPIIYQKPSRMTVGDWFDMTQTAFGSNPDWPIGTELTNDDAVLLEWPAQSVGSKQTSVIGITSYGTGEFELCNGNIFGLLLYPHRIRWLKDKMKYEPNPFRVEFYAFDTDPFQKAADCHFTLTAGSNLNVVDTPPNYTFIGKSRTFPVNPIHDTIPIGGVIVYDWFLKTDPAYFCMGDIRSSFTLTGTSTLGYPTFVDPFYGGDSCQHDVILECAETDIDPPLFSNSVDSFDDGLFIDTVRVHDDRTTDKGLKSFLATPDVNTDPTKFVITLEKPIKPCYNDKDIHKIFIRQLDSTIGGCFSFIFEDCIGNISSEVVCMLPHPVIIFPDTLKPVFTFISRQGSYDSSECNFRFDSIEARDNREHDKGVDSIFVLPGSDVNMKLNISSFTSPIAYKHFSVNVIDSLFNGDICIRAVDKARNYSDTCLHYCTIPDKLAPRISIGSDPTVVGVWHIIVKDDTAWDRSIDQIFVSNMQNVSFPPASLTPPTQLQTKGQSQYYFDIAIIDTSKVCTFCIKANDLAGNMSDSICIYRGIGTDIYPPNINFTPDPKTNPTELFVDVNDIHFNDPPRNKDTVVWDLGLDSIWFTDITGVIAPPTIHFDCATHTKVAPTFTLRVADSLFTDSTACITINAVDCNGNLWQRDWCYPYKPDIYPPIIVAEYLDKRQIKITVTDSALYDRGVQNIGTSDEINITPYTVIADKHRVTTFVLLRPDVGQSSYSTVSAVDYWGTLLSGQLPQHIASADLRVSIQDLALLKGKQVHQTESFSIPVYFAKNDTIPLTQKNITDFKFTILMQGDVSAVTFNGVTSSNTATENGWDVSASQNGRMITVEGHKQPATPFLSSSQTLDSLLLLKFTALPDESTRQITLDIAPINGETVVYNNGLDTIYTGLSSFSIMPPPWGVMTGGSIVIVGSCAPALSSDVKAQSASLETPTPNPISASTSLHYSVPTDGRVVISIYDLLGREVIHLLDQTQKQGYYSVPLNVRELLSGQYTIRLENNGTVDTKIISVQK